jgi:hypothetical protein
MYHPITAGKLFCLDCGLALQVHNIGNDLRSCQTRWGSVPGGIAATNHTARIEKIKPLPPTYSMRTTLWYASEWCTALTSSLNGSG